MPSAKPNFTTFDVVSHIFDLAGHGTGAIARDAHQFAVAVSHHAGQVVSLPANRFASRTAVFACIYCRGEVVE